jgi:hypothetical protein
MERCRLCKRRERPDQIDHIDGPPGHPSVAVCFACLNRHGELVDIELDEGVALTSTICNCDLVGFPL